MSLNLFLSLGSHNNWNMPLACAVTTNKQKKTYKTIIQQLMKGQPKSAGPKKVNVDFELAAVNAVTEELPAAIVQGCQFHLKQSVVRNLNSIGLKKRYETDYVFSQEIRQMIAVAFLPEHKVSYFPCRYFANVVSTE